MILTKEGEQIQDIGDSKAELRMNCIHNLILNTAQNL